MSEIRKNIYRFDVQGAFEHYGHARYLQVLYSKENYIDYVLSYLVDFKAPLRKAVPDIFHESGGHSKCNCLQDLANFHSGSGLANCPNF